MRIDRREFLAGGLAGGIAGLHPGRATPADGDPPVLRRRIGPTEDKRWYDLAQSGPYQAQPEPALMPLGQGKALVHAPRGLKSAPLVVFSHGALTDPIAYRPLLQHWVSHGFVVVAPKHDDSILERGLLTRTSSANGSSTWDVDRVLNDANAWDARVEACRVPLEHADIIGKAVGVNVSTDRPIIAGHEFGAYTAQLILGASVLNDVGKSLSFEDPRWYAGLLLSPQGPGIMGLSDGSWERLSRPTMFVQAGRESDFTGQSPGTKIDAFKRSPPGHKYLAWFDDAGRNLYTGPRAGREEGARDARLFEDMKAETTAYLTAYANQDVSMYDALTGEWPSRATFGRMQTRVR